MKESGNFHWHIVISELHSETDSANNSIFTNHFGLVNDKKIDVNTFKKYINLYQLKSDMYDSEEIINNSLTILYHILKTNTRLLNCMNTLAGRIISENAELGLVFLYSFDYMERTHLCVCEFLETGNISKNNIELLEKII